MQADIRANLTYLIEFEMGCLAQFFKPRQRA
jgi:hypothetical protein